MDGNKLDFVFDSRSSKNNILITGKSKFCDGVAGKLFIYDEVKAFIG